MYLLGTSGHVDHGKTKLIEALTGIVTDRLPEEKERGMTIDLGFAYFPGKNDEPVGVVDVPGHERFIRNMVAGAWSLDLALLVIAADDGWRQQTTDHAVILHLMGINHIILVITKCDSVPLERAADVASQAVEKYNTYFNLKPPSILVSAATGFNIAELKVLILKELEAVKPSRYTSPYLYIDRVFNIRGAGTVATGSLKGGPLVKDMEVIILPGGKKTRIRNIQTYFKNVEKAFPVCRAALNLPGIKKEELKRGNCIADVNNPFWCEREYLIKLVLPFPEGYDGSSFFRNRKDFSVKSVKNHSEIEIALGTAHEPAEIHFISEKSLARIVLNVPVAAMFNQPLVIIQHGGSSILGGGRVLWGGKTTREERKRLAEVFPAFPEKLNPKDFYLLTLSVNGFVKILEEDAREQLEARLRQDEIIYLGHWIFLKDTLKNLKEKILNLSEQPGGITINELKSKLIMEDEALQLIYSFLLEEELIVLKNDILFKKDLSGTGALSPTGRSILRLVEEAGISGVELKKISLPGAQTELRNLSRMGLVVALEEGTIFYTRASYMQLVFSILKELDTGQRFTIPYAKEKTGLSRKYMLPLLNRMEKEGYVKRDGDVRVVIKKP
ncbi:MAG: selenocysteine-specific translation elongation factor [Spirochaetota bacterium]